MDILNKIEEDFNDKFSNKLDFLVRNFGVISQKDLDTDEEKYKEIIDLKLKELLQNFIKTKVEEGNRLRVFFKEQLNILKSKLERVKELKPQVVENYKQRLLNNINSIKADINFQEMAKTMDTRQKERLTELSLLAQFLRRHQQDVDSQYGTEQFAALISFPYTYKKDIYPRTAWFSIKDKALDLSPYKRVILLRFPIFFHRERSKGDEGEIKIIFDNQELAVFKWDGFLEKIFL